MTVPHFSKQIRLLPVLLACFSSIVRCLSAAEGNLESLPLFTPDTVKQWSLAEATLEASTAHTRSGNPAMHWHVTVDYFGGEPKYPIGWPRITHPIAQLSQRDWSGWDYLHMWIYAETTRDGLPPEPAYLTIHNPDRQGAFQLALNELRKGQWIEVNIPITDIPRPADIRLMQFNISESHYRHQDQVDFYIDDLSLVRYAKPTLLNFAPETAVLFSDSTSIPITFKLTGLPNKSSTEVTFEIRQGKSVEATTKAQVQPGVACISLTCGKRRLNAGNYVIAARIPGADMEFSTQVRLIDSPWKKP